MKQRNTLNIEHGDLLGLAMFIYEADKDWT